jgi:hypothetical protein
MTVVTVVTVVTRAGKRSLARRRAHEMEPWQPLSRRALQQHVTADYRGPAFPGGTVAAELQRAA